MEDFPDALAYCEWLKMLSDQLKNVGAPISNQRLLLQILFGLTDAYKGVGTLIRQSNPLPHFYHACSMLTLEVASLIKMAAMGSNTTIDAETSKDSNETSSYSENSSHNWGGKRVEIRTTTTTTTKTAIMVVVVAATTGKPATVVVGATTNNNSSNNSRPPWQQQCPFPGWGWMQ